MLKFPLPWYFMRALSFSVFWGTKYSLDITWSSFVKSISMYLLYLFLKIIIPLLAYVRFIFCQFKYFSKGFEKIFSFGRTYSSLCPRVILKIVTDPSLPTIFVQKITIWYCYCFYVGLKIQSRIKSNLKTKWHTFPKNRHRKNSNTFTCKIYSVLNQGLSNSAF